MQKIFVKMCGISQATYTQWKNGTNEMSVHTLCKICKTLNISADYLLGLMDVQILNTITKLSILNEKYNNEVKEVLYNA